MGRKSMARSSTTEALVVVFVLLASYAKPRAHRARQYPPLLGTSAATTNDLPNKPIKEKEGKREEREEKEKTLLVILCGRPSGRDRTCALPLMDQSKSRPIETVAETSSNAGTRAVDSQLLTGKHDQSVIQSRLWNRCDSRRGFLSPQRSGLLALSPMASSASLISLTELLQSKDSGWA